jgi:Zn-dependent peptidase ImmA (M78 family)/transcriptional regulator with XRE-family HTH domain
METDQNTNISMSTSGNSDEEDRIFNPRRLALARRRRGLKKTELADAISVDPRSLVNYEAGQRPKPNILARIAQVLKFPESFFYGEDIEEIDAETVSFRSLARMTASHQEQARGQGALCVHLSNWLETRFALPQASIPEVRLDDPEVVAAIVRTEWALGVQPIPNMIQLLESHGVRIFSLSIKAREVDAFSMWKGDTPFVMLNVQKTCEHSRFDAAHELGHLVMHRHGSPSGKESESVANRFASAFLMPAEDVRAYARPNPGIPALIQWKKRWGVSLAALNYRMHQLGLTTDYHYRQLCIQISRMGLRQREIEGMPRETSLLLNKVLLMLAADRFTRSDLARELCVLPSELNEMMFGLAMTTIPGNRMGQGSTMHGVAKLRLVGSVTKAQSISSSSPVQSGNR